jgi:hypothetical protein
MAVIATSAFVLNNCKLTIGTAGTADNYEGSVSAAEFVPSASSVNWKGLTPSSVFTFQTIATWVLNLSFAQDWATANSLAQFLLANEGSQKTVVLTPLTGGKSFTAVVNITPGSIGGAVDAVAVGSVALGVIGKPAISA